MYCTVLYCTEDAAVVDVDALRFVMVDGDQGEFLWHLLNSFSLYAYGTVGTVVFNVSCAPRYSMHICKNAYIYTNTHIKQESKQGIVDVES